MKTIKIKDYYGIYQEIPVSDELYEEWRALQNETQRIHRKEVYHRDWTPMDDLEEMPQHFTLNELEDALIWDCLVYTSDVYKRQGYPIQIGRSCACPSHRAVRDRGRSCHRAMRRHRLMHGPQKRNREPEWQRSGRRTIAMNTVSVEWAP